MNVLIACEESQRVCMAFRARGHNAFSCDIQEPSGGHPEWHIKGDAVAAAEKGKWDLIIAHPPCTFLSYAGNRSLNVEKYGDKAIQRYKKRCAAAAFFMKFVNLGCPKICIENPLGIMSKWYRRADQIIHPYFFANKDSEEYVKKRTCLWLKGLPPLQYKMPDAQPGDLWCERLPHHSDEDRAKLRSKTFICIAEAMAKQWG